MTQISMFVGDEPIEFVLNSTNRHAIRWAMESLIEAAGFPSEVEFYNEITEDEE